MHANAYGENGVPRRKRRPARWWSSCCPSARPVSWSSVPTAAASTWQRRPGARRASSANGAREAGAASQVARAGRRRASGRLTRKASASGSRPRLEVEERGVLEVERRLAEHGPGALVRQPRPRLGEAYHPASECSSERRTSRVPRPSPGSRRRASRGAGPCGSRGRRSRSGSRAAGPRPARPVSSSVSRRAVSSSDSPRVHVTLGEARLVPLRAGEEQVRASRPSPSRATTKPQALGTYAMSSFNRAAQGPGAAGRAEPPVGVSGGPHGIVRAMTAGAGSDFLTAPQQMLGRDPREPARRALHLGHEDPRPRGGAGHPGGAVRQPPDLALARPAPAPADVGPPGDPARRARPPGSASCTT